MKILGICTAAWILCQPLEGAYILKPKFKIGLGPEIKIAVTQLPAVLSTGAKLSQASVTLGYWIAGKSYPKTYALDLTSLQAQVPAKALVPWVRAKQPAEWTGVDFIRLVVIDAEYLGNDPKNPEHLKLQHEWPHSAARIKTLSLPFIKMISPSGYTLTIAQSAE